MAGVHVQDGPAAHPGGLVVVYGPGGDTYSLAEHNNAVDLGFETAAEMYASFRRQGPERAQQSGSGVERSV